MKDKKDMIIRVRIDSETYLWLVREAEKERGNISEIIRGCLDEKRNR